MMRKFAIYFIFLITTSIGYTQSAKTESLALEFLNSLNSVQKEKAIVGFEDENRTRWHYFPSTMYHREGIPLKELDANQKKLLHNLLQAYLSEKGYKKATDAIEFEGILRDLTNDPVFRDAELYYVTFYGKPTNDKPWGWGFEGHHLSLNFTINGDHITYVPLFYGSSPAIVLSGPQKGRRALKNEEDMGLKLINILNADQRKKAIINDVAFKDILSGNKSEISPFKNEGISISEMNSEQQELIIQLIYEYISSMPSELANSRMKNIKSEEIENIYFAWAGNTELRKPHYYRIQGKTFLIELDNTQNNANHIHVVWRDFDGDFGRNLIKEHYQKSH